MDEVVREAAEAYRETLGQKSVALEVSMAEPLTVLAPAGMTACVVNNLLANAVNFTGRGRIDVRIEHGALIVQDSGVGIPPTYLSRIFERRYRSVHSRGLGLGLYLIKRICERLAWDIRVSSAPGPAHVSNCALRPRRDGAPVGQRNALKLTKS